MVAFDMDAIVPFWTCFLLQNFLVSLFPFVSAYFFVSVDFCLLVASHHLDFTALVCLEAQFLQVSMCTHSPGDFKYFLTLNIIYIFVTHRFTSMSLVQIFLLNSRLLCPTTVYSKSPLGCIKEYQVT